MPHPCHHDGDPRSPTGLDSKELRALFRAQALSPWFQFKARAWSYFPWNSPFDPGDFLDALDRARFREYSKSWKQKGCIGWAGCDPEADEPRWLFAAWDKLRWIPLVGSWIMQHELFHGLQDYFEWDSALLHQDPSDPPATWPEKWWRFFLAVCEWACVEGEAYLFGTPIFFVFALLPVLLTVLYWAVLALIECLALWDIVYRMLMG